MLTAALTDKPFTDLYETGGRGGYPGGLQFKARPVVGGHFAFLALERACGGKATDALQFLEAEEIVMHNVKALLLSDKIAGQGVAPWNETPMQGSVQDVMVDEL